MISYLMHTALSDYAMSGCADDALGSAAGLVAFTGCQSALPAHYLCGNPEGLLAGPNG